MNEEAALHPRAKSVLDAMAGARIQPMEKEGVFAAVPSDFAPTGCKHDALMANPALRRLHVMQLLVNADEAMWELSIRRRARRPERCPRVSEFAYHRSGMSIEALRSVWSVLVVGALMAFVLSAVESQETSGVDLLGSIPDHTTDPAKVFQAWARSCSRCQHAFWTATLPR